MPGWPMRSGSAFRTRSRPGRRGSFARPTPSAWASTGRTSRSSFTTSCPARSRRTTRKSGARAATGAPADAVLLWNYVDVRTREFLIEREDDEDPRRPREPPDPEQRERRRELERRKLRRMIAYADSTGCHRATLLGYFGEKDVRPRCGACGNCGRRRALDADQLLLLRKILSGVARGGERWGKRRIAAMLTGRLEGLPERLIGLSTTGLLEGERPGLVEEWIEASVGAGLLKATEDAYRTLALTGSGREVMAGRVTDVEITLPEPPPVRAAGRRRKIPAQNSAATSGNEPVRSAADPALLEALRHWRRGRKRAPRCAVLRRPPRPYPRGARGRSAGEPARALRDPGHRAREARGLRARAPLSAGAGVRTEVRESGLTPKSENQD